MAPELRTYFEENDARRVSRSLICPIVMTTVAQSCSGLFEAAEFVVGLKRASMKAKNSVLGQKHLYIECYSIIS